MIRSAAIIGAELLIHLAGYYVLFATASHFLGDPFGLPGLWP